MCICIASEEWKWAHNPPSYLPWKRLPIVYVDSKKIKILLLTTHYYWPNAIGLIQSCRFLIERFPLRTTNAQIIYLNTDFSLHRIRRILTRNSSQLHHNTSYTLYNCVHTKKHISFGLQRVINESRLIICTHNTTYLHENATT